MLWRWLSRLRMQQRSNGLSMSLETRTWNDIPNRWRRLNSDLSMNDLQVVIVTVEVAEGVKVVEGISAENSHRWSSIHG